MQRPAQLTTDSHRELKKRLIQFGNTPNTPHLKALHCLLTAMTNMAEGKLQGRWAFGLPTGTGKTRAIIEWATQVHHLELPYTLAVSASRIEALCTLKREMIENGIPEGKIGLLHDDAKASMKATADNDDRPFMLVTHQRVRSKKDNLSQYNVYKGQPRHLLIYDESLMISDVQQFDFEKLCGALANAIQLIKRKPEHTVMTNYLVECLRMVEGVYDNYDELEDVLHLIKTPSIDPQITERYARDWEKDGLISHFLKAANLDLRMLRDGDCAIVGYRVLVPTELQNVLVLDASYPIRELCLLDKSIQDAQTLPLVKQTGLKDFHSLKRFDQVTLHRLRSFGGRHSIEKRFKDGSMAREVVTVLKTIPEDQAALFYLYKMNQVGGTDYRKILEREIVKAGIDLHATVKVTKQDGKTVDCPRIVISTWGNETSLNSYSYCAHVFLVGILHRDSIDLMASYLGQINNIQAQVDKSVAYDLQLSEKAHLAYQALSRGTCRTVSGGQAQPMTGYLVEIDPEIETTLNTVMPGVTWKKWAPYFVPETEGLIETWATQVQHYLNTLPHTQDTISSQSLRKAVKAEKLAPATWTKVIRSVTSNIHTGSKEKNHMGEYVSFTWKLEGRSLVKQTAEHHGFIQESDAAA